MPVTARDSSVFVAGAAVGIAVTACFLLQWRRMPRATGSGQIQQPALRPVDGVDIDDEVVKEHLSRNLAFFGRDAMKDITNSYVIVVGLGGVGAHAAHLLLRSGVGHLRLVDFDQVRTTATRGVASHMRRCDADSFDPIRRVAGKHVCSLPLVSGLIQIVTAVQRCVLRLCGHICKAEHVHVIRLIQFQFCLCDQGTHWGVGDCLVTEQARRGNTR